MGRTMPIIDVFHFLLTGAFIVDKCHLPTSKSQYMVMLPTFENKPHQCAGHITEKQFIELCGKGVILFSGQQRKDNNYIYGVFYLNKEGL